MHIKKKAETGNNAFADDFELSAISAAKMSTGNSPTATIPVHFDTEEGLTIFNCLYRQVSKGLSDDTILNADSSRDEMLDRYIDEEDFWIIRPRYESASTVPYPWIFYGPQEGIDKVDIRFPGLRSELQRMPHIDQSGSGYSGLESSDGGTSINETDDDGNTSDYSDGSSIRRK
jgi:hypothetical protein